jgi:hypothetical protein
MSCGCSFRNQGRRIARDCPLSPSFLSRPWQKNLKATLPPGDATFVVVANAINIDLILNKCSPNRRGILV